MTKLHTLYSIVPINDKCSILCEDVNGTHITISKSKITNYSQDRKLLFVSKSSAQKYINNCLDSTKFFVEELGGNDELLKIAELCETYI